MTDSICAFPPNKVTQLDPKEPNEQMPSLWSDNGGLLWLTPQALAIFLELKNKIGKRKKGHNFYQANPPWEITVYVPVHEHTWVIFFFSLFLVIHSLLFSSTSEWPLRHLNAFILAIHFTASGLQKPQRGGNVPAPFKRLEHQQHAQWLHSWGWSLSHEFCCLSIFCHNFWDTVWSENAPKTSANLF